MKKMKIENQKEFDSLIEKKANLYFEDFKKVFDNKKHKDFQKDTFLLKLRQRSEGLESDKKFTGIFNEIRNFDLDLDKDQSHFIAIEKFLEKSKRNRNEIINYLTEYYATIKAQKIISVYSVDKQNQNRAGIKNAEDKSDSLLTIENIFIECKDAFNNEKDYFEAANLIKKFFLSEQVSIAKSFFVKNGNIKKMAFALGEIWRTQKNEPITYEYLNLYKQLFSIFKTQKIDEKNIFGCNLYKYSISKT